MDTVKTKTEKKNYISVVGRCKSAVARVRLFATVKDTDEIKKGEILINKKPLEEYFFGKIEKAKITEPLRAVNAIERFAISIVLSGGGMAGQLKAAILGISRALEKFDKDEYRTILKKKGFLTRDARVRERRKVGTGGKARRQKQSPKR